MLCIQSPHTDPCFNLAAEEYALTQFMDDCFMLYRNVPSIIVGKHQNALAEINMEWVRANNIQVVRRLSGGGTVFHDLGNLNFAFIATGEEGKLVDFRRFTRPIQEVLGKLGVETRFEGRNNLTIKGLKISGNAEHIYRKRTLHHGTLLFSSELADLSDALKVDPNKYTDKAVQSIRSRVTNISEHLSHPMNVDEFGQMIMQHILDNYDGARMYSFSPADTQAIELLRDEKYTRWEWNFGYSPRYLFERQVRKNGGDLHIYLRVEKGVIGEVRLSGGLFDAEEVDTLKKIFTGLQHDPDVVKKHLSAFYPPAYMKKMHPHEFVEAMF